MTDKPQTPPRDGGSRSLASATARGDGLLKVAGQVADENKTLRAALEIYANSANWRLDTNGGGYIMTGPAAGEPTEPARNALEHRQVHVARPPSLWKSFWRSVGARLKRDE